MKVLPYLGKTPFFYVIFHYLNGLLIGLHTVTFQFFRPNKWMSPLFVKRLNPDEIRA